MFINFFDESGYAGVFQEGNETRFFFCKHAYINLSQEYNHVRLVDASEARIIHTPEGSMKIARLEFELLEEEFSICVDLPIDKQNESLINLVKLAREQLETFPVTFSGLVGVEVLLQLEEFQIVDIPYIEVTGFLSVSALEQAE